MGYSTEIFKSAGIEEEMAMYCSIVLSNTLTKHLFKKNKISFSSTSLLINRRCKLTYDICLSGCH